MFSRKKTALGAQYLPDHVVESHILPRLDFKTKVRSRAVKKAWRRLCSLPSQPWLCVSPTYSTTTDRTNMAPCISLADLSKGDNVVGSRGQYIIATSTTSKPNSSTRPVVSNPFNGQIFPLPTTTMPLKASDRDTQLLPLRLARLSSPPTHADNDESSSCVVAAVDNAGNLFIVRPGVDHSWTSLDVKGFHFALYGITDLVFYRDELVYTIGHHIFYSLGLETIFDRRILPAPTQFNFPLIWPFNHVGRRGRLQASYMIASCDELLMVILYQARNRDDSFIFGVFRLVGSNFLPVGDLGDKMLFVGKGCSRSWSGDESPDGFFSRNCIYYIASCDCSRWYCMSGLNPCVDDKVRSYRLCKWSVVADEVVDSLLISSRTFPTWVTPNAALH